MDENNVSFQNLMFLILLSFIALGSESQIFVNSSTQTSVFYFIYFFAGGGRHVQKPKFGDSHFFSEKKTAYGTKLGSISHIFH